ncbi:hypothetical protein EO95_09430 [Methanosarcina sp. 1.H.T.1A.1]|uniref:hypothetical protein n=1 Tax=Methanosarcina sp. 1.H.T.1A.1 TaxID=1483602 RepID=UPI0006226AED|nr:hypothetical protein [Methanosarcina sp. 1.H.T.1A.1]KKH92889.1 hypothetical protein EO95_09430 [Methanosarcina sp. 1.H.T.1A.1]
MANSPLRDRMYGFEMSGGEYQLIFEKENMGYVRFMDKTKGIFYLDPSPFLNTPYDEVYFIKAGPVPPKGQLISATVSESEKKYTQINNGVKAVTIKYVVGWTFEDPNKLIGNRLVNVDEFLGTMTEPLRSTGYDITDTGLVLGMCAVASPKMNEFEPGGLNSGVFCGKGKEKGWTAFKKVLTVVPTEFRRPASSHYYKLLETAERIRPINSIEVSLAYRETYGVQIHLPIPFDVELKPFKSYDENAKYFKPMARSFLIDALMFQPVIPEKYLKRLEGILNTVSDDMERPGNTAFDRSFASALPKLAASIARLYRKTFVSADQMKESMELWSGVVARSKRYTEMERSVSEAYALKPDEGRMLSEIKHMKDTGIPLTISNLRLHTTVPEWRFDETLANLVAASHVYFPGGDKIGLIGG